MLRLFLFAYKFFAVHWRQIHVRLWREFYLHLPPQFNSLGGAKLSKKSEVVKVKYRCA